MSIQQSVSSFADVIETIAQVRARAASAPHMPTPPASGLYSLSEHLIHIRALLRAKRTEDAEAYVTHVLDRNFSCWRCGALK